MQSSRSGEIVRFDLGDDEKEYIFDDCDTMKSFHDVMKVLSDFPASINV